MPLDATDLKAIAAIVNNALGASRRTEEASVLPRLTPKMFAVAAEMHVETVRHKIRVRDIPRGMVFGERPIKISPAALKLFGITPQEALARLAAHNLWPEPSPSSE